MTGQVRDVHVAPFQGKNHSDQGFDDQSGQVGVIRDKDNLFFHEDRRNDQSDVVRSEGEVKKVTKFIEGVSL